MPMLSVFGVELPVLVEGFSLTQEEVGESRRSLLGAAVRQRRAVKHVIEATLAPRALHEAMLYRELALGLGEFWSLQSSVYGAKGYAVSGTGSLDTTTASRNPRHSTGTWRLDNTGETMVVQTPSASQSFVGSAYNPGENGGTLVAVRYASGAYRICGFSWGHGDTSPVVARERLGTPGSSGAAQAWSGDEAVATSTSAITFTAPNATARYWSCLLWLPRYFPTAQVDQLLAGYDAGGFAAAALPAVAVTSDLFPSSLAGVGETRREFIALGEVREMPVTPVRLGGSFVQAAMQLMVRFVEV